MDQSRSGTSRPRWLVDDLLLAATQVRDRAVDIQRAAEKTQRRAVLAQQEAERVRTAAIRARGNRRHIEQRKAARSNGRAELGGAAKRPTVRSPAS
jgi:hypothetical protein